MGGGRRQACAERDESGPTGVPRWVTLSGLVAVLLLVVMVVVMLLTGGGHGPGRHVSWAPQPAVPSSSALAALTAGRLR